jgi:mercuric reductase
MINLTVEGMTCESCARHVVDALRKVSGVERADVDYPTGHATVSGRALEAQALIAAVSAVGYSAIAATNLKQPDASSATGAANASGGSGLHIAVIGSGGAAMATALKAAEQGAQHIAFPRRPGHRRDCLGRFPCRGY